MGDRVSEYEEILAYHLEQSYRCRADLGPLDDHSASVAARAAQLLASSGRRAFARTDLPACANLLGRAIELLPRTDPERVELLIDLATALTDEGRFSKAEELLGEAIEVSKASGSDRLGAHAELASLRLRLSSDPEVTAEEVRREAERAIALFEAHGDHRGLSRAWYLLSWAHWLNLRAAARQEALEHALEHARRAGDRPQELESLSYLTSPPAYGPMPVEEGFRFLDGLTEQARGDRKIEAAVVWSKAMLEAMRGHFEDARDLGERSIAILEDLGMKVQADASRAEALGYLEILRGDTVAAEREYRAAYEALDRMDEKALLSTIAAELARLLWRLGRHDEMERFIRVSKESAASDDILSQIKWRNAQAMFLASQGDADRAVALAREAVALAEPTDVLSAHADALMDHAEVLRLAGRSAEAASAMREALRLFELKGNVVSAERTQAMLEESSSTGQD